ncbi:hypothetical protein [Microbulbifer aggregans]|uniref:hypothetical protein n=1 Tax=Microbulbifer aggregans TaxID=1769779 RepID=UPI001CFEB407|nr:hypothetical protein [Microbulbifer aggregans]
MRGWSRHLEALTRAISPMKAEGIEGVSESESEGETGAAGYVELQVADTEVETAAESIEQALVRGMQVSLGDLEPTANGWLYRGSPVMVFGVDVAAVADSAVRREFFHRVHIATCCGALEDPAQAVWIGTARDQLSAPGLEQAPHACEYCLAKVNHQGFRALPPRERSRAVANFNFFWHVSQYADEYFQPEVATFWAPGRAPQIIEPVAAVEGQSCHYCDWQLSAEAPWILSSDDAQALGIEGDCCVICAQQQATGIFTLPEPLALAASDARFHALSEARSEQEDAELPESWSDVRRWLPLSWHPLIVQLESRLGPPQLFQRFTGYDGVAVLAWPDYRRGIIVDESVKASLPEGWDFWPRSQVLSSLG